MLRRFSAAAVLLLALGACKDDNILHADQLVTTDTLVAYALTGSPPSLPSGLAATFRTTVRVDGSGSFDVAFDLNSRGDSVIVAPVRTVISPLSGVPSVGLQLPNATFDAITSAPGGYYRPDTAIVVAPGEPFVLLTERSTGATTCLYNPAPHIYAKVVIDSVQPATHAIYLRQVMDPNCGYRSFEPGLPAS